MTLSENQRETVTDFIKEEFPVFQTNYNKMGSHQRHWPTSRSRASSSPGRRPSSSPGRRKYSSSSSSSKTLKTRENRTIPNHTERNSRSPHKEYGIQSRTPSRDNLKQSRDRSSLAT